MPRSKVIPLERVSELYSTFPGSKVIPFDSLAFESLAFESFSVRKLFRSKVNPFENSAFGNFDVEGIRGVTCGPRLRPGLKRFSRSGQAAKNSVKI